MLYSFTDEDVCGKWVKCNQKFAQDFINNSSLPACPCFFPLIRVKSKDIFDVRLDKDVKWVDASSHSDLVYKPGAFACMRSSLTPGTTTLAVQQCCYDGLYSLVTRGKSAGTPVLISPEISKELHYKVDLLPWIICKGDWTRLVYWSHDHVDYMLSQRSFVNVFLSENYRVYMKRNVTFECELFRVI